MNKDMTSISRLSFSLIIFTLICMVIGGVAWSSVTRIAQDDELYVAKKTLAFQVVSIKTEGTSLQILLRNVSHKNINGYKIGIADGFQVTKDLALANEVIKPNDTDQFRIAISPDDKLDINILSVIFDDGTTDGDPNAAAELTNKRLGMQVQLGRIISLLQSELASPDANTLTVLDRLKSHAASLPVKSDGLLPSDSEVELHGMKDMFLTELEELRLRQHARGDTGFRKALIKLKQRLEKRIASIQAQ
jgi:hypothetical protein